MDDGWIRLRFDDLDQQMRRNEECIDEPASGRAGPPVADVWLFADCKGERSLAVRVLSVDAWTQDVYWREGNAAGEPKFQTVAGNPFMQAVMPRRDRGHQSSTDFGSGSARNSKPEATFDPSDQLFLPVELPCSSVTHSRAWKASLSPNLFSTPLCRPRTRY